MQKEKAGDIFYKDKLDLKSNKELKRYYDEKWKSEGYKKGYIFMGMNISKTYDKARKNSALKFLAPNKKEIILDAGCGEGDLSKRIAKKSKKVYAVDISKKAFPRKNIANNLIFREGNIESLPFSNGYFDKIVCVETLEHVLNPKKAIKELHRVLKKDGILVLSYPTIDTNLINRLKYSLKISKPHSISEHITEWSYDQLIKNFKANNFKFIYSEGVCFYMGRGFEKLRLISKSVAKAIIKFQLSIKSFPRLSQFVTVKFRK